MYLPKMTSRVLLLVLVGALICTNNYARKLQGGLGYIEGLDRWFEIGYSASIGAGGPGNAGVGQGQICVWAMGARASLNFLNSKFYPHIFL
ncbi:hypothetical protein TIFTF001_036481 [Ficus carica]|uniref:Uncharacterized protein n=1 Tax=Ficus carica TaxID=3494 RepID=A0AA88E4D1_FICCA|nr:hypothetical protein TIFTF001_036481 [Ficus carica]